MVDSLDFEYRVIHAQGIENIYWDNEAGDYREDANPKILIDYFGEAPVMTQEEAQSYAFKMEEEIMDDDFCPVLEYGVSTISLDKPFEWYQSNIKEVS